MEPKVTFMLAKVKRGFLNCHKIRNNERGTTPAYKSLVMISLLVIELKATLNGNSTDDFLW